jgi:hypothetical protein
MTLAFRTALMSAFPDKGSVTEISSKIASFYSQFGEVAERADSPGCVVLWGNGGCEENYILLCQLLSPMSELLRELKDRYGEGGEEN